MLWATETSLMGAPISQTVWSPRTYRLVTSALEVQLWSYACRSRSSNRSARQECRLCVEASLKGSQSTTAVTLAWIAKTPRSSMSLIVIKTRALSSSGLVTRGEGRLVHARMRFDCFKGFVGTCEHNSELRHQNCTHCDGLGQDI